MTRDQAIAAVESLPAVERIACARLAPDDVIVIESESFLSCAQSARIKASLEGVWPSRRIVVLDGKLALKVVGGAAADGWGDKVERRNAPVQSDERRMVTMPIEMRLATGDTPTTIDGYGARYNEETIISGLFREKFLPGSLSDSLRSDDILVTFNHDPNVLLGRKSNATATFSEDAFGARYNVALNANDPDAQRVSAKVQRRDVSGSSLIFKVQRPEDEEWSRDDSSPLPLRTIKRAKVIEMGPVSLPYYADTTAAARSRAEQLQAGDTAALTAAATGAAVTAARAAMTPDEGEEAAELVQYQTAAAALTQAAAAITTASEVVRGLITDETESPTETADAEAAEEELETARLRSLLVLCAQICGAVSGVSALAQAMLSDEYDPILYARSAAAADGDRARLLRLARATR